MELRVLTNSQLSHQMVMTMTCTTHSSYRALNPSWPGWCIRGQAQIGPTTLSNPPYDHWLKAAMTDARQCVCLCVCVPFPLSLKLRKISSVTTIYKAVWSYSTQLPPLQRERACQNSTWLCPAKVTPASGALSRVIWSDRNGPDPSHTSAPEETGRTIL